MASVNKVILIGNIGRDPELRETSSGQSVCNFSMATNEQWKDKNGEKQERTEWHRLTAWGKTAEILNEHLSKGSMLYVEGKLQTREWEDKEGIKRYTTEILVLGFQFLGGGKRSDEGDDDRDDDRPRRGSSRRSEDDSSKREGDDQREEKGSRKPDDSGKSSGKKGEKFPF